MIRKDLSTISDEEFDTLIAPIEDRITKRVKDKLIDEFIAYYLNEFYREDALFDEPLINIINGAIDGTLSQFTGKDCDISNVNQILEKKYKLRITNEKNLDIVEI